MSRNVLLALAIAFMAALTTGTARAENRVVVRPFYGPNAEAVRKEVEDILERRSGVVVLSSKEADVTAKKLDVDANSPEGRKVVAKDMRVSAWVEGIVQKRAGKLRLTVLVYDGANHDRVGRTVLVQRSSPALMAELKRDFWQKSQSAIRRAAAPGGTTAPASAEEEETAVASSDEESDEAGDAEEETASDAEDEDEQEEVADATPAAESEPVRSTSTSTAFLPTFTPTVAAANAKNDAVESDTSSRKKGEQVRASIGLGSPYRSLAYNDIVTQQLGDYTLTGAPMLDARVAYHPAAAVTDGWASWIGIDVRMQMALGIRTVDSAGNEFKSKYDNYHLGALLRAPVGKHFVRGVLGYGIQRFSQESKTKDVSSPTPNTDYRFIRMGLGGDFAMNDKLSLGMDAAWLQMLSVGQIGEWFPRSNAAGVEFGMDMTYAMNDRFYARLFGGYQRVFFDFHSKPGDSNVAGGATDNYVTAGLGAGIHL
jgi:hypothetical protein